MYIYMRVVQSIHCIDSFLNWGSVMMHFSVCEVIAE